MKLSEKGNAVYLDVGVWLADDDSIHMTVKGAKGFHTTINNTPGSKRCHPNLYLKLARVLEQAGAPHPTLEADKS